MLGETRMQRWLRCILMLVMVATASAQPPLLQELISAARGASEPEKITKIQEDDPRAVKCARQAVEVLSRCGRALLLFIVYVRLLQD